MATTISIESGVMDSAFGFAQYPIRDFITSKMQAWEETSMIKKLFQVQNSDNAADTFTSLTTPTGFRPIGENEAIPGDDFQEGYSKTIMYRRWGDSFAITSDAIKFKKLNDIMINAQKFTDGWNLARERFAAQVFGEAIKGNTSFALNGKSFDLKGADGLSVFNTAHPAKVSGANQSNMFADEFSVDALDAVESAMHLYKDDNNNLLNVGPDTILIPDIPSLKRAVFAALGSDRNPDNANNAFNFQVGRWNVIVWSYLNGFITAGTMPWIMMDSRYNSTYGGAKWMDYGAMSVKSFIDQNNNANKWNGEGYFNAGFVDWRFAAVGGIAGGTELL